MEVRILSGAPMEEGERWMQVKGRRYVGRRGVITEIGERITLKPVPGLCTCPAKQRTTSIPVDRFLDEWVEDKYPFQRLVA